jgi:hypothetical protein
VYDLYWQFACERQAIFDRRMAGEAVPWTEDPILRAFKFCNVYRAADRVSQYLIRDVIYADNRDGDDDLLFRIVAFRLFSRIATWRGVVDHLGRQPVTDDLISGAFLEALDHVRTEQGRLYTGAFILCAADAYGQGQKHRNHVALLTQMFATDALAKQFREAASLRAVYELLHTYPLMGDFMSYQIAIDLNYSPLLNFSENSFTAAGPGALRGLKKAFTSFGDYRPNDLIMWMVNRQVEEFERLGLAFTGLYGRPLHAIDCQGLFCEVDKYCREAVPELLSARKRIKTRFKANEMRLEPFFPPKWGINSQIAAGVRSNEERQLRLLA